MSRMVEARKERGDPPINAFGFIHPIAPNTNPVTSDRSDWTLSKRLAALSRSALLQPTMRSSFWIACLEKDF